MKGGRRASKVGVGAIRACDRGLSREGQRISEFEGKEEWKVLPV